MLRGLGAFGGKIGNQALDLVRRHRGRQLQYDGRAGGLGGPSGRHCAEQKQQRQGKRSCRHRPVFKLKCSDDQTARSNGEWPCPLPGAVGQRSRYSVSGCFDGWASAKAGIAMQLS